MTRTILSLAALLLSAGPALAQQGGDLPPDSACSASAAPATPLIPAAVMAWVPICMA